MEPQVFDLLTLLVRNHDRVVTRDEIIQIIWSGRIVSDSAISTRINALRHALGDDGSEQRLVKTITLLEVLMTFMCKFSVTRNLA